MLLLIGNDDVAHVGFQQRRFRHRQQAVGIGRQIDPHHLAALVARQVDEARILVGEAVVVLPPHGGGDQAIPGGDRGAPGGMVPAALQPFGVLVEHRGNHMGEGLVGVEEAVATGEEVALHHSHQGVLAEHLHHPATAGQLTAIGIFREQLFHPHLLALLIDRLQAVGGGFIGAEHPQRIRIPLDQIPQQGPKGGSVLRLTLTRLLHHHRIGLRGRKAQPSPQQAAIGVGAGAHPQGSLGREGPQLRHQAAVGIKQLLGAVAAQPGLQQGQLLRVGVGSRQGHLVGAPKTFELVAVELGGARPALGGAQHQHRPGRPHRLAAGAAAGLDGADSLQGRIHRRGHGAVHRHRLVALHKQRLPAVAH